MNWSDYLYLAPVAALALGVLAVVARLVPGLSTPSPRRTKQEIAVIALVCTVGVATIYFNFLVGTHYYAYGIGDVGSDTLEQYVPFYFNLVHNVRDGTLSAWNWEYDLGVSYTTYQSWLFDPFNCVIVAVGLALGDAGMGLALVLSQILKIVLSAFLFDHFLTRFCETPLARVVGSLLYAFSGYMILYGQHYWLGSVFPVFTLVMLLFELYLERTSVPRFVGLTAGVAFLVSWSPYIAFMVLLFAAVYLLLRIPYFLERVSVRSYGMGVLKMVLPVLCGLLLSGIALVPYATFLLGETTRTSSDTSLLQRVLDHLGLVNADWFPAVLSRVLGSGLINTGSNPVTPLITAHPDIDFTGSFPYEFILLGYSGGCLILLSQFWHWAFTECSRRDKVLVGAATALVLFYCFGQFLPTLLNAMVKLQYRSSFAIGLPVCAAMAVGFEKRLMRGKVALVPAALAATLSLVVLVWSLANTVSGRWVCTYYLLATVALVALLVPLSLGRGPTGVVLALVAGAMISMSVVDGFFDTNSRGFTSSETFPLTGKNDYGEDTLAAIELIRERDDSFYRIDKAHSTWTPLNDSLIQDFAGVSAYNSSPDADVYEFRRKLWKESVSTWAAWSAGFKNDPNCPEVLQLLNMKYYLSTSPLEFEWATLLAQVGDVYVYQNTLAESIASVRQHVVSESSADALEDSAARRELLATSVIVPNEVADELGEAFDSSVVGESSSQFYEIDSGGLTGSIECSQESVVCLSIPNTGTWEVTVNGERVDTFRADYGFIGFVVQEGVNEVTCSYHVAGLELGGALTLAGALGTIVASTAIARRRPAGGNAPHGSRNPNHMREDA